MISLKGPQSVVETLYVVSSAHLAKTGRQALAGADAMASLRAAYHAMIGDIQPVLREVVAGTDATGPVVVGSGAGHAGLVQAFLGSIEDEFSVDYQVFGADREFPADVLARKSDQVTQALETLGQNWPELRGLYELVVPVLLYAPDGGLAGGTASTVLGVLWLDPKDHWNNTDVQEFLLHEFVHHTLFLEERRHGFYRNMNLMLEERYLTRSAIRLDRRPLDKVLHSIVVGLEVLLARSEKRIPHPEGMERSLHPDSGPLRNGVENSLDEVFALPLDKLLKPRPIEILELCRERIKDIPEA